MPNKLTKEQAQYEPVASSTDHCRDCVHFLGGTCAKVEGSIKPSGWCLFYIGDIKMADSKCTCDCTPCRCKDEIRTTLKAKTWREHETFTDINGRVNEIKFLPEGDGLVPRNPFASQAQAGYLHAHPEKLGAEKLAEFDQASKGLHLPKRVAKK